MVKYDTAFGAVEITAEDVKKYLVRGGGNITDQEIKLFLELCKYQKLNPFVGECYPIKFGNDFQLVVGYETYKRRAEENPTYAGRKSGIVVLRGDQVVQKEGTCLYPKEELIGGWCRVFRKKNGEIEETYKEVSLKEYDKGQANWKTKPCTMIEKVAVSQALRAAFPRDYEGLYTVEEAGPEGYVDADYHVVEEDEPITQEQRQQMFALAQANFGKKKGNELIASLIAEEGFQSTTGMPTSVYKRVMGKIQEAIDKAKSGDESPKDEDKGNES
jgi:phage recombination protein Bet